MWSVTILGCQWWVSNLNVGQNSFITKSTTWSSIIQIFYKLPPNFNLNLSFILRLIFYPSWIDWIRYFSMISLIIQQLNIYTLDASISILITHFLWGQSPNFETFMFGAWVDSALRLEGNQRMQGGGSWTGVWIVVENLNKRLLDLFHYQIHQSFLVQSIVHVMKLVWICWSNGWRHWL